MVFRILFVGVFLLACLSAVAALFWTQEVQYATPTPVPANYIEVAVHDSVTQELVNEANPKPVHLHFFNPECPCSRFNITHFQSLVGQYASTVDFYMVIPAKVAARHTPASLAERFDVSVPILVDDDKALAVKCGVYSTPQAVILDEQGDLYFRGNYNKTRYCTNPESNFAQMAIDAILMDLPAPDFGPFASVAYGCQLPQTNHSTTLNTTKIAYGSDY